MGRFFLLRLANAIVVLYHFQCTSSLEQPEGSISERSAESYSGASDYAHYGLLTPTGGGTLQRGDSGALAPITNEDEAESALESRLRQYIDQLVAVLMRSPEGGMSAGDDVNSLAKHSVVMIDSRVTPWDAWMPWTRRNSTNYLSSGFIIANQRIICCAVTVVSATSIYVRRRGVASQFSARMIAHWWVHNVAILTVDDERFWAGLRLPEFGSMPKVRDSLVTMGYDADNSFVSVPSIVSRIETASLTVFGPGVLVITMQDAIPVSCEGGPVMSGGKIVGVYVARGNGSRSQAIPTVAILHILQDLELHGHPTTAPGLPGLIGTLTSPVDRKYFGLGEAYESPDGSLGMLMTAAPRAVFDPLVRLCDRLGTSDVVPVSGVPGAFLIEGHRITTKLCEAAQHPETLGLMCEDIVLSWDGHPIYYDGTYDSQFGERLSVSYIPHEHFEGDLTVATVMRNRKVIEVQVPITGEISLVSNANSGEPPEYVIFGGLVFISVTRMAIDQGIDMEDVRQQALLARLVQAMEVPQTPDLHECVLLSYVVPHELNRVCPRRGAPIHSINGVKIRDLRHLKQLLDAAENDSHVKFGWGFPSFEPTAVSVMSVSAVKEAEAELLLAAQIPAPYHFSGGALPPLPPR